MNIIVQKLQKKRLYSGAV